MKTYWPLNNIPELDNLSKEQRASAFWACFFKPWRKMRTWCYFGPSLVWWALCTYAIIKIDTLLTTFAGAILAGLGTLPFTLTFMQLIRPYMKEYVETRDLSQKPKAERIITTFRAALRHFLFILLVASFALNGYLLYLYQFEKLRQLSVMPYVEYAAWMQAHADYRKGTLRLCEVVESDDLGVRGKKLRQEGAFEIVSYTVRPQLGRRHILAQEAFVRTYNEKMKYWHENPSAFDPDGVGGSPFEDEEVPQQGAPPNSR